MSGKLGLCAGKSNHRRWALAIHARFLLFSNMTFLNPLVLIGLAASAIPIIIHLFNLRKLKTVEFSSLRFLKELQKTRMRRVRIRQWLLLLLRTLIIIALVLAFARPALRGTLAGVVGTHARTTSIVILDDSPSMGIRSDRGILFSRAKETAAKAAGLLQEGDEIVIVRLSEIGGPENPAPARTREEATRILAPAVVSSVTVPYRDAFGLAARLLAESQNFNKEIYLLSDLQKTQFTSGDQRDTSDLFGSGVRVFVSAPAAQRQDNAGIPDVQVTSRILIPGRPAMVQALIRNFGAAPVRSGLLSVYLDGTRVLQQSLELAPGGSISPALTLVSKRRGIIRGYLQLEDDILEADNRRFFVLDVPQSISMLVVGPTEQETRLAVLALTLGGDSAAAALKVQAVTEAQLSSIDLARFDVVMTCGVRDFSPSEGTRLSQYVRAGGGMLVFPGDESDIANYNAALFSNLGIPAAGAAVQHAAAPGDRGTAGGYLSFGKIDFAHPLFTGLFEEGSERRSRQLSVESPQVYRSITLQPGTAGQAIIALSNGTPFLAEYPAGSGRALVAAVEAGLQWSDLPRKGIFVPLLHRSAAYLAARQEISPSFLAGEQIRWRLRIPDRTDRDIFVVRAPDGTEEKVVAQFMQASGSALLTSGRATAVGIYDLQRETAGTDSRTTSAAAAVNPDPAESDLGQADDATLQAFWTGIGLDQNQVVRLREGEELERTVQEARFGVELWKYLIGLAVLFALLEMLIGREPRNAAMQEEV